MPPRHPPIPSTFFKPNPSSSSNSSPTSHGSGSSPLRSSTPTRGRPLSIAELADKANEASDALPFSPLIPIRRYLNGASTLRRQAAVYHREGDRESEFICLVKCARLLIELLPNDHPQFRQLDSETRRSIKRDGQALLDAISEAKTELANRFDRWNALSEEDKAEYGAAGSLGRSGSVRSRTDSRGSRDAPSGRRSHRSRLSSSPEEPSRRPPSFVSYGNVAPSSLASKPAETDGILFKKPDRGDDGFDIRRILGFGKSASNAVTQQKREVPKEIPYQPAGPAFTSSPLDSFTHAHSKGKAKPSPLPSKPYAEAKGISYPALKSKPSHRMSAHQTQQGFAPSSNATARYYQTLKAGELGYLSASSGGGGISGRGEYGRSSSPLQVPLPVPGRTSLPPPRPAAPVAPLPYAKMPVPQPASSSSSTSSSHQPRSSRGPLPTVPGYPQDMPLPFGGSRDAHGPTTSGRHRHSSSSPNVLAQAVQQMTLGTGGRNERLGREAASLIAAAHSAPDEPIKARTEGGQPLRSLLVPEELIGAFVGLADPNTRANLETCALLQGKLERNRFRVSHLLFPQQTATSDSCTTSNEEEIMAFQERHDLITLGWIHTHPTQSCFLSSLDLHTHAGYQMMLPEAIAIVCSPAHEPSFGLFRLTDPTGLKVVVNCREPGLFHPHVAADGRDLALYTDAVYGHVALASGIGLEIVDLRRRR